MWWINKITKPHIVLCAAVIISLMALFPPWVKTFSFNSTSSETSFGYHPIILPPATDYPSDGIRLDYIRLLVQWAAVMSLAGGLLYAKDQNEKKH